VRLRDDVPGLSGKVKEGQIIISAWAIFFSTANRVFIF
jgi:hypothetical protein